MHLKFEEFWEAFARIAEISSLAPPGSEKGEYNNADRKFDLSHNSRYFINKSNLFNRFNGTCIKRTLCR